MNPFKIQFYGDYKMRLLDIVSPFLTEGLELESVLADLDVSLVLNSEMTHGYGSMTDRILTARLEVRYHGEVIHTEEDYDITSSDSCMF